MFFSSRKGGIFSIITLIVNVIILISAILFFNIAQVRQDANENFLTTKQVDLINCELLLTNSLNGDFFLSQNLPDTINSLKLNNLYSLSNLKSIKVYEVEGIRIHICSGSSFEVKQCLSNKNIRTSCRQRVFDILGKTFIAFGIEEISETSVYEDCRNSGKSNGDCEKINDYNNCVLENSNSNLEDVENFCIIDSGVSEVFD